MSWRTLTYFGDSMLLIPTAVIIALVLPWKSDNRRTVWYWLLAFGLAGLLVSISKIMFLGFGIGSARYNFTGFSGHSAMSATLWPVMMWLISARWPTFWRALTIGIGYLIPLMVGLSRLVIHAHSVSEVLAGLMLGFTLSSAFLLSQRRARKADEHGDCERVCEHMRPHCLSPRLLADAIVNPPSSPPL